MEFGLLYLVVIVGFFVFVTRTQRRRAAAHRALLSRIGVGDEVVTSGGIFGTIASADGDVLELAVAPGVLIRIARGAILRIVEPPAALPQPPDGVEGPAA